LRNDEAGELKPAPFSGKSETRFLPLRHLCRSKVLNPKDGATCVLKNDPWTRHLSNAGNIRVADP
jgi:hypothetical protein